MVALKLRISLHHLLKIICGRKSRNTKDGTSGKEEIPTKRLEDTGRFLHLIVERRNMDKRPTYGGLTKQIDYIKEIFKNGLDTSIMN